MAQETPVMHFLQGLTHLVVTAERTSAPQSPDEFYTAMQARQDASALIDFTMEKLIFLGQRLGKLPPLPDIMTLITEKYTREEEEEEVVDHA